MLLDISIGKDSLSIQIDDPFHSDINAFAGQIGEFASPRGIDVAPLDLPGLIKKMIKGIAGCEHGCPADAKGFVARGFHGFKLEYVEGGILTATAKLEDGKAINFKMFPDF
ncbi:MAG: hypothetical protein M0Z52_13030 [Actinomycetota bacterium]|nr:hypothetical protein [Actinomycetota bacterium]